MNKRQRKKRAKRAIATFARAMMAALTWKHEPFFKVEAESFLVELRKEMVSKYRIEPSHLTGEPMTATEVRARNDVYWRITKEGILS